MKYFSNSEKIDWLLLSFVDGSSIQGYAGVIELERVDKMKDCDVVILFSSARSSDEDKLLERQISTFLIENDREFILVCSEDDDVPLKVSLLAHIFFYEDEKLLVKMQNYFFKQCFPEVDVEWEI